MNSRLVSGFVGGCLGAIILVIVMYILQAAGMGEPAFVGMYKGMFGENPPGGQFVAAILFILSGGIWGLFFGLLVKNPSVVKGIIFGILPTLWLWLVVNSVLGKPLFNDFTTKGLLMPIIFNMVIWGSFIGWYMAGKRHHTNKSDITVS